MLGTHAATDQLLARPSALLWILSLAQTLCLCAFLAYPLRLFGRALTRGLPLGLKVLERRHQTSRGNLLVDS